MSPMRTVMCLARPRVQLVLLHMSMKKAQKAQPLVPVICEKRKRPDDAVGTSWG
jgi:hypothetical protein